MEQHIHDIYVEVMTEVRRLHRAGLVYSRDARVYETNVSSCPEPITSDKKSDPVLNIRSANAYNFIKWMSEQHLNNYFNSIPKISDTGNLFFSSPRASAHDGGILSCIPQS